MHAAWLATKGRVYQLQIHEGSMNVAPERRANADPSHWQRLSESSTQATSERVAHKQANSAGRQPVQGTVPGSRSAVRRRATRESRLRAVHERRWLHHNQHVGMPQHAILACEAGAQVQKMVSLACGRAQCKPAEAAEGVTAMHQPGLALPLREAAPQPNKGKNAQRAR